MRLLLTALIPALLPLPALAEGARLVLDCRFVTACDAAGACSPGEGPARFTLAPAETDAAGAGRYAVTLDDGAAPDARAPARTGPWVWQPDPDVLMTLALTGEQSALWIRQSLRSGTGGPPAAEIDLMTCEVTA